MSGTQPDIATAFQRAIRAHKAGQLAEAEKLYRAVLHAQPRHPDANHNLGVLMVTAGRVEPSLPFFKAALQANPTLSQYWVSYADALVRAQRVAEAADVLAQGRRHGLQGAVVHDLDARVARLRMQGSAGAPRQDEPPPAAVDALLAAHREGRLPEAEQLAADLSRSHPGHPLAWTVIGRIRQRQGQLPEALQAMEAARTAAPAHAAAHINVADILVQLDRLEEAEAACRRAIVLEPGHALAHSQLGAVLRSLGRLDEAEVSCRQAIALQPGLLEAHGNLGIVLRGLGRLDEAEASCRHALSIRPDHAGAHANLAAILIDRGKMTEAESSLRQAIALRPDLVQAHVNLGVALMGQGRFGEAIGSFREALGLAPGYADAHSNLLYCLNFMAEVRPEQARAEALAYGLAQRQWVRQPFSSWRCRADAARLRVGFVSGDFRSHPVAHFLLGLLQGLRGSALELFAYPTNASEDDVTARLKPHFTGWHPIWRLDDAAAARRIHEDGIHVLIDLAGHTAHNRLPVFVHRPAPVQVAWLGYFATTGLTEIDHVLGDPWVTPQREESHFVERVWRLPETYFCFSAPDVDVPVGQLPALTNGHLTFGCFNNLSKVNDASLALWARVLRAIPSCRLFLKAAQLADDRVRDEVLGRLARVGVGGDRVWLEGPSPRTAYFEAYHRVDVALDPFPFPGGTTSVEGLWMGVPVLTKKGDRFIGHNGETIAHNTGLSTWVAGDDDEFVEKACSLTSDLAGLAALRASLRRQVLAAPLFDGWRFARHFEDALWGMWRSKMSRSVR